MSAQLPPGSSADQDEGLDKLLGSALSTRTWSSDSRERVRLVSEREWRAATQTTPASRRWLRSSRLWGYPGVALAAGCAALVLLSVRGTGPPGAAFGSVARLAGGTLERQVGFLWHESLPAGSILRVGDRLVARGGVLVALAPGGTLRVAPQTRFAVAATTRLDLHDGSLYVDTPTVSGPLQVSTARGTVEHVGTEFEVTSAGQQVRIRVREGRVHFGSGSESLLADAGTELLVSAAGSALRRPIATSGSEWAWVMALAPAYQIEGQPLTNFLNWVSRELGQPLQFSGARTQELASQVTLHGSIDGIAPLDALAQVLATTSLRYELRAGVIQLHSAP
jgi:FecR protein